MNSTSHEIDPDSAKSNCDPYGEHVPADAALNSPAPSEINWPVTYLQDRVPEFGVPIEVAAGIWLIRLPISLAIDHVNVYLLEDGDSWTLVDAGCNTDNCREVLLHALERSPFVDRPISRVVVTHFHPDHVGMAGFFAGGKLNRQSARLLTSRTTWHSAQYMLNDNPLVPHDAHVEFMQLAGITGVALESFKRRRPSSYASKVAPLPDSYQRLRDSEKLRIGERTWQVRMGNGHADEHVTLWSDDNIAIVGDQILPAISPNLSVHYSEPQADCIADWLHSCELFAGIANRSTLCLPGHNRPFSGAPTRCKQLIENCQQVLDRIVELLAKPKTAMELIPHVYRRELEPYEKNQLTGEIVGYLNHLVIAGRVTCKVSRQGCHLWCRLPKQSGQERSE